MYYNIDKIELNNGAVIKNGTEGIVDMDIEDGYCQLYITKFVNLKDIKTVVSYEDGKTVERPIHEFTKIKEVISNLCKVKK